jgi:3-oxoacyl-[acyl-carrier-protein] synthase II
VDRKLDPARFGVEFGAAMIANEPESLARRGAMRGNVPGVVDLEKWGGDGIEAIQPLWMLKYLPNFLACQVSIMHDAQGPSNSITENEVAPLLALGGRGASQRDDADFFLVGGSDLKRTLSMARQSRSRSSPSAATLPRKRAVRSTAAGTASSWARVVRASCSRNWVMRSAPGSTVRWLASRGFDRRRDGKGPARHPLGPERGRDRAGGCRSHQRPGLRLVEADRWRRAIREAFGDTCPPVFAAKSYFGNLGAGGAPVELAISLLALQHGTLPPTLNYEEPDPECPIPVLAGSPHTVRTPYVLKISFTGMGQCAALVVRRPD